MSSKLFPWLLVLPILAVVAIGVHAFASVTPTQPLANYRNDQWHFSIKVPSNMTVDDVEKVGAEEQIIQFSDASANHMFEIAAAPYSQMDVALGEEGAPSSNEDQPANLGIVNVYHEDAFSVGFHRKGIAYTITAVSDAGAWLIPILQSWEFTN